MTLDETGLDSVTPNEAGLSDEAKLVDPLYCMDYDEEAIQHNPELDADGEDEEQ